VSNVAPTGDPSYRAQPLASVAAADLAAGASQSAARAAQAAREAQAAHDTVQSAASADAAQAAARAADTASRAADKAAAAASAARTADDAGRPGDAAQAAQDAAQAAQDAAQAANMASGAARDAGDLANDPTAPHNRTRTGLAPLLRGGLIGLLVVVGLLLLGLLLSSLGLLRISWLGPATAPTRELILGEPTAEISVLGGANSEANANIPPVGSPPGFAPPVGAQFEGYYYTRGQERVFGRPLTAAEPVNGRMVQWFERARLEHWPEYAGTPYEVQLGLLGKEYTEGRPFSYQGYFVSNQGMRYFPETGYAVGGVFLRFYDEYGGLDIFGLPISEEFDEVLPDGRAYRVQYFQRARMEYHPEHMGTPDEVQLGLLGTALYRNEPRPSTTQPVPTEVPMP
jgi:hypothetical protein